MGTLQRGLRNVVRNPLRVVPEEGGDEFALVGEAADGAEALSVVETARPDVVLLDLRMPGMDGIEALERIRRDWPEVAVVILTTYSDDELMIRALEAGARGYLLKDVGLGELFHAIRTVALGGVLVQPEVMDRLVAQAVRTRQAKSSSVRSAAGPMLTEREKEVLTGLAQGERTKEIAARLKVTERTVWAHLSNIYSKLGVDSRASAVAVAIARGILPYDSV